MPDMKRWLVLVLGFVFTACATVPGATSGSNRIVSVPAEVTIAIRGGNGGGAGAVDVQAARTIRAETRKPFMPGILPNEAATDA